MAPISPPTRARHGARCPRLRVGQAGSKTTRWWGLPFHLSTPLTARCWPRVIFVGSSGGLYGSLDGGATWAQITNGLIADELLGVVALAVSARAGGASTVFACTSFGVFRSLDTGSS